jgi:hypothetical protein
MPLTPKKVGLKYGFRSGLEEKVAAQLVQAGVPVVFEQLKLKYTTPATDHVYTPDFELPNGIIVETKGRFLPVDRKKHLLVKAQNPEKDIRFVFSNSKSKITKTSKTTYAAWCEKHGFQYADKLIPEAWPKEKPNHIRNLTCK